MKILEENSGAKLFNTWSIRNGNLITVLTPYDKACSSFDAKNGIVVRVNGDRIAYIDKDAELRYVTIRDVEKGCKVFVVPNLTSHMMDSYYAAR